MKEKYLENYPIPISLKSTEKIIKQMKNSICKIKTLDGNNGTGFFCEIPYNNDTSISVFITNNHIINKKIIEKGEEVLLTINGENNEIN